MRHARLARRAQRPQRRRDPHHHRKPHGLIAEIEVRRWEFGIRSGQPCDFLIRSRTGYGAVAIVEGGAGTPLPAVRAAAQSPDENEND
jgi:phosphatidylserine/phosphatidylglycerophosphate/cardiolipin synthase-like enzyme